MEARTKDKAAYARGELVEPIKPIVYYLDPATPEKFRKWFKLGIEDWQVAFEAAGFKMPLLPKTLLALKKILTGALKMHAIQRLGTSLA